MENKIITMTEERLDQIITKALSKGQLIVAQCIVALLEDDTCTKDDISHFCDNFIVHGHICLDDARPDNLYDIIKEIDRLDDSSKH